MSSREILLLGCATLALLGLLWLSILDASPHPLRMVPSCYTLPESYHGDTVPHTIPAFCRDSLTP